MEFIQYAAILFGIAGLSLGAGAYARLDRLEKKLQEKNLLEEDWQSQ